MQPVGRAVRHDVDPTVGHRELAAREVEIERAGEAGDVPIDRALERRERRRQPVHAMGGAVRCIAARIALGRPPPAGRVVQPELPALAQQPVLSLPPAAPVRRAEYTCVGKSLYTAIQAV